MVIDAPAKVLGPGICPVAPPAIVVGFFIEVPEGIYKTAVDEFTDPFSFFRQES